MHALRKLLLPFSWIYGLIIAIRNGLYDSDILHSVSFHLPLICVGNLSVGGTGKTPMVELLIRMLKDDHKLSVLSRGYKRISEGFLLAGEGTTVEMLGDEPFQYHTKFKDINVAVDASRINGIENLMRLTTTSVILLDDAFQHRKVKAGFNILLTVFNDLYVNDHLLPAGNLRDNRAQSRRADIIVVTKCPPDITVAQKNEVINVLGPSEGQKVFFAAIRYSEIIRSDLGSMDLVDWKNRKFTLVTGIANPDPLLSYLKNAKLEFNHLKFADHHHFSEKELDELRKYKHILTTEKDYMRLRDKVDNIYYLPIETFILDEEEEFQKTIRTYIKKAQ